MNRNGLRILVSVFLILLGAVILLNNLNVLPWDITTLQWFWFGVFALGGLAFLAVFFGSRENWWAIIPSFTLFGLAFLVSNILPDTYGELGGAIFLGMIGLSFWVIYGTRPAFWWAVIPGGVLVTVALVALVSDTLGGIAAGAILFFGMALTFLAVYFLPTREGRMRWAIWPALGLAVFGVLVTLGDSGLSRFVVPAALILAGAAVLLRASRPKTG